METRRVTDDRDLGEEPAEPIHETQWAATGDDEPARAAKAPPGVFGRGFHRLEDNRVRARYAWLGVDPFRFSGRSSQADL